MVKAWFNKLDFDVIADIQYTYNGKPVKPYLSSVSIIARVEYDGKHKDIDVAVFPRNDKIVVEYLNDGKFVVGESPIKISDPTVRMVFENLVDKLLPITKTVQDEIQEEIKELSSLDSDELPNITQTIRISGTIFDENPYGDYVGKVSIKEYISTGDATGHKVAEESFEVKKSSDGELTAVVDEHGKEVFNPTYQEMLDILIPSKGEFEDLMELIKDAIGVEYLKDITKELKAEYGDKNIIS